MKMQGTTIRFGLWIAGLVALTIVPLNSLMAQVLTPPTLVPTGTVTGVVRNIAGIPASGIRVTATRVESAEDAVRAMASLTETDSTGRFRLENVPPGRYYITAGRVDLPTYYPGTLEMTKGTVISVSSTATISDIDFVIQDSSATLPPGRGGAGVRGGGPGWPGNAPVLQNLWNGLGVIQNLQARSPNPGGARSTNPNGANPTPPPAPVAPPGGPVLRSGRGSGNATGSQPGAAWWTNTALVTRLGLTGDQMKKIETIFDQYRQTLVQNKADLEREEASLARMLESDPMEPTKTITSQIDRVVQTRGEMERTNSKMTLDMRQSLTRAQWVQLQSEISQPAGTFVVIQPGGFGTPAGAGGAPAPRSGGRGGGPAAPQTPAGTTTVPPLSTPGSPNGR